MILSKKSLAALAAVFALGLAFAAPVRAADEVANPQYHAWAKFKPGSSATLTCDAKVGKQQQEIHIEMTTTLTSVTPEAVEVTSSSKVEAMGHSNNPTPEPRSISAKAPAKDVKEAGEKDVEAVGKTFKCKVIEVTGELAGSNGKKPRTGKYPTDMHATLFVNHDVPGGLVKM